MKRVVYTSHAKLRLRVRGIDESEINRVLRSPQKLYFDTLTGALVAVGSRALVEGHSLVVVYTIEEDIIKVVTGIDVSSIGNLIRRRVEKGRWVEIK
jgi:hypothetical protein